MTNQNYLEHQGRTVEWTSTSNGTTSTKTGIVEGTLPAGVRPIDAFPWLEGISSVQNKLGSGVTGSSSLDRLLVKVERTHAQTGEPLSPWYYAPRRSHVQFLT